MDYAVYSGPTNFNRQVLLASVVLPGDLLVYGFTVYSTNAAAQFVNVFDNADLPADAAVPLFSWPVAAHNGVGFSWAPNGRRFYAGITLCNSSTDTAKTLGSADCFFDVQYDLIADGNVVAPVHEEQNAPGTGE